MRLYKYEPLPSPRHIRYVKVLRGNDELQCQIENVDLDYAKDYYALSYVWGHAQERHDVHVMDQGFLSITSSLNEILIGLRDCEELGQMLVWVDGICINQNDKAEKRQQVSLMRQIYKRAKSVITCIGPQPDLDLALSHMALLWDYWELHQRATPNPRFLSLTRLEELGLPASTDPGWKALYAILNHPWSRRVWIVQESLVNQNMLMLCGTKLLDWNRLVKIGSLSSQGLLPTWEAATGSRGALSLHLRYKMRELVWEGVSFSLVWWLDASRKFECSDPRDRIFAFLGLANDKLQIFPNYEESFEKVYTESAARMLEADLQVLNYCSIKRSLRIPSWAPDWSIVPEADALIGHLYRAGGQAAQICFSGERMTASGLLVEEVQEIWQIPYDKLVFDVALVLVVEVLWKLKRFPRYRKRGSAFAALWRTLVADIAANKRASESLASSFLLYLCGLVGGLGRRFIWARIGKWDDYLREVCKFGRARSICITKSGYLCLAPPETQSGDVVGVLAGARIPFVFRRVVDEYELVGAAYVHGIMDGELVKQSDVKFEGITLI